MTEGAGDGTRSARWGTAVCLAAGVIIVSALESLPLVLVPLALLMLTSPSPRRWRWIAAGLALGALGLASVATPLGGLSRGWALLLGGGFALLTLWKPQIPVLPRALVSVGFAGAASVLWLGLSGRWRSLDDLIRLHLIETSERTFAAAREASPDSSWIPELAEAARQVAQLQADLFPGIVALQSLATLALVAWLAGRLRLGDGDARFEVRPWREFRFNDQLVWLLIGGLAMVLLPLGEGATRVGYNLIVFMTVLYALRGVGVFLFISVGASTMLMIVFGALAAIFLYPLILGAAILVGLGDTWLDVRGRAVAATRT